MNENVSASIGIEILNNGEYNSQTMNKPIFKTDALEVARFFSIQNAAVRSDNISTSYSLAQLLKYGALHLNEDIVVTLDLSSASEGF
jgi:hypothetical protein